MTRFEIVWKILTMPCSETSRITSELLDRTVPAHDRLAVQLHMISCASCRRYRRQILAVRRISTRLARTLEPPGTTLPDDVRERIKKSLKGH